MSHVTLLLNSPPHSPDCWTDARDFPWMRVRGQWKTDPEVSVETSYEKNTVFRVMLRTPQKLWRPTRLVPTNARRRDRERRGERGNRAPRGGRIQVEVHGPRCDSNLPLFRKRYHFTSQTNTPSSKSWEEDPACSSLFGSAPAARRRRSRTRTRRLRRRRQLRRPLLRRLRLRLRRFARLPEVFHLVEGSPLRAGATGPSSAVTTTTISLTTMIP
jgi:hypothetical protein